MKHVISYAPGLWCVWCKRELHSLEILDRCPVGFFARLRGLLREWK